MGFTKRIFAFSINLDSISPTAIVPLVTVKDWKVFTNSRDLAEHFGKRHDHVLRDIDALIEVEPACAPNFGETSTAVKMPNGGTRKVRTFDMTRDGFTLLAMGFTGAKALQFKLAYIAAFNEMEAKLKTSTPALPNFADPAAQQLHGLRSTAPVLSILRGHQNIPCAIDGQRHSEGLNGRNFALDISCRLNFELTLIELPLSRIFGRMRLVV